MSPLKRNRSIPASVVIPELAYPDVPAAAEWLCRAFGFFERLRIADHRVQLTFDDGAIVVTRGSDSKPAEHRIMVRVADVDAHYERAKRAGAKILAPPADHVYGERQYNAEDPGGHLWTFTETIADSDPASWGGELVE